MSLPGVITRFATGTYTRRTRAAGTDLNGRHTPGALTDTTIDACVQPVPGKERITLPEARDSEDYKVIFTSGTLLLGDLITFASEAWEIYRVEAWQAFGTTFTRAVMVRKVTP